MHSNLLRQTPETIMHYRGPERRRHQVLVTKNSHYHMNGDTCVAVVDPRTGKRHEEHVAVGSQIVGRVNLLSDGSWELDVGSTPTPGKRIFFSSHLVTSPLREVARSDSDNN